MTAKELALPIGLVASILTSAVLISNSYGRNTQALIGVQGTLVDIRADLKETSTSQRALEKIVIEQGVRVQKLESLTNDQAALNARVLGHLESRGD